MNIKGDIPSILFAIISIVVIGIIFFFLNHVNDQLYTGLEDQLESNAKYNTSEIIDPLEKIHRVDNSVWDYAFLAIAMGYFLALILSMYATRISAVFYWIYGLVAMFGLLLATILSNLWQEMVANGEFVTTLTRFPITNAVLGTYYPTLITAVLVIAMVLLFGKRPGEG